MGKKIKIKIGKLLIFNIYASQQIHDLFCRVGGCEEKFEQYIHTSDPDKIAYLNEKVSDLQSEIRKLTNSKKADSVITLDSDKEISRIGTKLTDVEDSIVTLDKYTKKLEQKIKELENKNAEYEQKIAEYEQRFARLERIIENIQNATVPTDLVSQPKQVSPTPQPPKETFKLPVFTSNEKVCLINDSTERNFLTVYFERCIDISRIVDVIKSSDIYEDDKVIYEKLMNSYKINITKSLSKLNLDELEDYEISEAVITAVGKNVKDIITSKLVQSLCEKLRKGNQQYQKLLDSINSYLSSIGFYTEVIEVGEKITEKDNSVHMDSIYEKTADKSKHGIIREVETYPYLINFIDEDENPSVFVCKGLCVVYRFE